MKYKIIENGEVLSSYYLCRNDGVIFEFEFDIDGELKVKYCGNKEVCLFTGILDKNGAEIYEGDTLEWEEEYDKDCMPDDAETYLKRGVVFLMNGVFGCDEDDPNSLSICTSNNKTIHFWKV